MYIYIYHKWWLIVLTNFSYILFIIYFCDFVLYLRFYLLYRIYIYKLYTFSVFITYTVLSIVCVRSTTVLKCGVAIYYFFLVFCLYFLNHKIIHINYIYKLVYYYVRVVKLKASMLFLYRHLLYDINGRWYVFRFIVRRTLLGLGRSKPLI